eukprot:155881_1
MAQQQISSTVYESNSNVNNHSHNAYSSTGVAANQSYELSYISSICNQHSHIGTQVNNHQSSQHQIQQQQIQQPSQFVTTYYQSESNNHHIGNVYDYNLSQ